jgi:hypothetical protein
MQQVGDQEVGFGLIAAGCITPYSAGSITADIEPIDCGKRQSGP